MANIKDWIEQFEEKNNEKVVCIVVGLHYNDYYDEQDRRPEDKRNVMLSRKEGLKLLDEEFDSGYGGADCFRMLAWTQNFVLKIYEYDGSTGLEAIPRNPLHCEPDF